MAQIGARRDLNLPVVEQLVLVRVRDRTDRDSRRIQRVECPGGEPGGHDQLAGRWTGLPGTGRLEVLQQQLVGVADRRDEQPGVAAGVLHLRGDGVGVIGDQRDDRDRRVDGRDLADQRAVAEDRILQLYAVIGALVDLDRLVPERRVAGDHVRADGVIGADADAVVEPDLLVQLDVLDLGGLGSAS